MYEILYQNKPEHVILHNGPIPFERLDEIELTRRSARK